MRKHFFYSAVFSLFLLVPATIIRAQTVSLTGVVYQNNTAKIPFTVPEGKINILLPDDMSASNRITGTVFMEATGKNEKQKEKNLELLKQYVVTIGDAVLDADILKLNPSADPGKVSGNFNLPDKWWGTTQGFAPASLLSMKRPVAKAEIPLILIHKEGPLNNPDPPYYAQRNPNTEPTESVSFSYEKMKTGYEVQKKVITSGENLVLQNNKVWSLDELAQLPDFSYYVNDKLVLPLCSSPRQTIMAVPPGTIGKASVVAKDKNGKTIFTDQVYVVYIKASIDKTNLRKNERTNMHVSAVGVNECPYPISMAIVNNASETVLLDKGVHQTYHYDPAFESMRDGIVSSLDVHQGVTGVVPGAYNITANLILPTTAFGDVFHQQKSALKTPEDYNAWVDAVKKDLKAYADKQGNDEVGKAAKANAERAIDNIPKCYDKNKLDECKAFADAYLRPVNIPKGAATMWVCGFEAYKAAVKAITGTLGGKAELIDWEVIKNGLEFIRNMGEQLNDEGLQNGASDAKKMVETIQKAGETKEKLQELKEKLDELNPAMNGKISNNPEQIHNYSINDLQVSGFIHNFQPSINYSGRGNRTSIEIDGFYESWVWTSLERISQKELKIESAIDFGTPGFDWMKYFLDGQPLKKSGRISHVNIDNQSTATLDFKDALITEISFPKMDAAGKDILMISFTFKADEIKYTTGSGKVKATDTKQGKQWMPSNFKIELGDLPCDNIKKTDAFSIKQQFKEYRTGPARDYKIEPGKIEYPNLTFYIPELDIKPWKEWFNEYEKSNETKSGSFHITDANAKPQFTINLDDIKPVQINPDGEGEYKVTIASLTPAKGDISGGQQINIGPARVNDLIGVFNPFIKILFFNPDYRSQVFSKMDPQLRSDGKYNVNVMTANRKPIQTAVSIIPITSADLFDQSVQLEEKMNEILCDLQDKQDRTPAERITETWDKEGTGYRVYKNAKCVRFKEGGEVPCREQWAMVYSLKDTIGTYKKTGKYEKSVYSALSHCFKGTDFCTEMYFVDLLIYVYDDANCKRLIDVKKYHAWSCE